MEKILPDTATVRKGYVEFYHAFKEKNGYSRLEIQKKRIALENILIPYSFGENCKLLCKNGFQEIEEFSAIDLIEREFRFEMFELRLY